jgi:hypothetical protein
MANIADGPAPSPGDGASGDGLGPGGCDEDDWPDWDLDREPPSEEELHGIVFDPDNSPPDGWELMTEAQRRALVGHDDLYEDDEPTVAPEVLEAGFTHRYGGSGVGFAPGGPLDAMLGGEELAWHAGNVRRRGLGGLSDYELCGLIGAAGRLESWSAELKLPAVAELDARRAGTDGREGEHVAEEVGALLKLTGRSANDLLELTRRLERLPATAAMLAAGLIDRRRAEIIADHLAFLSDAHAAAVQDAVLPRAPDLTTGELGSACQKAVKACDPEAAIRRRKKAEKEARVETWAEAAGTAALAGRDLAPASVVAADKTLDADARWLKAHGAPGGHDQLRASAMIARLTGQPLDSLLDSARRPAGQPAAAGGLGGSVNLTMPAAAWLGPSDAPGEIAGTGAADAETCRDLGAGLAASPAVRWCVTLVDARGRAVAHGCARAGPGPPGSGDPAAWLARVRITPIETGECAHRRESAGYQPSDSLRHIVKVRSRRCGFPGCRRPAVRCDDDHTIPYHKGGKTCECNLHPLCRRHHQTKQAPGWRLDQPQPGILIWTLPSGRKITVNPEPYPA